MLLGKSNQSSIAVLIALQHEEEINEKRMHKLCTILTASALLAMSVTVYAAEGDNTEAGFQPAEAGTVQSADTEQTQETASEQTEEKDPEENGLDSFIYIREKEDKTTEKAKVKK